jgi:hypothetical protein
MLKVIDFANREIWPGGGEFFFLADSALGITIPGYIVNKKGQNRYRYCISRFCCILIALGQVEENLCQIAAEDPVF